MSTVDQDFLSTPAENTRRKKSGKANRPECQDKSIADLSKPIDSMVHTPKISQNKEEIIKKLRSKSAGKQKRGPNAFRILKEEKKEELIQRWLHTSKSFCRLKNNKEVSSSAELLSSYDSVKSANASVIAAEQTELASEPVLIANQTDEANQSLETIFGLNTTKVQSLTSLRSTSQEELAPQDKGSIMSCQVATDRKPKAMIMYKLSQKLRHQKSVSTENFQSVQSDFSGETDQIPPQSSNDDNYEELNHGDSGSVPTVQHQNEDEKQEDTIPVLADEVVDVLGRFKKRLDEEDKTVFYDMFELLITKMSTVQAEIKGVKETQSKVSEKFTQIEHALDFYAQSIEEIDADLEDVTNMNVKIVQATLKCDDVMTRMQSSAKMMAQSLTKGAFLIHGLDINKEDTVKSQVTSFFEQKMLIPKDKVKVTSAHPIGKKANSPIWFKLEDPDDTAVIYEHMSNLKGKKNSNDRGFRLQEFTDEQTRESKVRQQDLQADNHRLPLSHQATMKYDKGQLQIDGNAYAKQVSPPTIKDVILIEKKKEKSIEEAGITAGAMKVVNGSTFYAYLAETKTIDEIKAAYEIIKNEHISSTHVVCGYRLFNRKFYNYQDYSDDGEHFAGKTLLNVLKEMKVWNLSVFVVRYHEGPNLGKARFKIYEDMAKDVLASLKKPLNYGQAVRDKELLKVLNKAEDRRQGLLKTKFSNRGRGRQGGPSARGNFHQSSSRQGSQASSAESVR